MSPVVFLVLFGLIGSISANGSFQHRSHYRQTEVEIVPDQAQATPPPPQEISVQAGQLYNLKSNNYPLNYPANADSTYIFTSPNGTALTIECPDFNIPCASDYLSVFPAGDTSANSTATTRYCHDNPFTLITSTGNKLGVIFHAGGRSIFDFILPSYRFECDIKASGNGTSGSNNPPPPPPPPSPASNCTCGIRNSNGTSTRIVGGTETTRGEIPWRVLLNIRMSFFGPNSYCGGSIISPNWIMTAAHCTANLLFGHQITVITGAQYSTGDGKNIVADRYVQNPDFNPNTMDFDMTLVHLPTPLVFDQKSVAPICLPWNMQNETFDNVTALGSGWGTTKPVPVGEPNRNPVSKTLMKVELPVLGTDHCKAQFPQLKYFTNNMLCTYLPGKDTCQGDSGGSIDYQPSGNGSYYGIGVVSFGEGCAQENYPGVYSKVTNFLPWIQSTTGASFCEPQ